MTGKGALMCPDTPLEGAQNAAYMKAVLESVGFEGYENEWCISTMFPPNLHLLQIIRYNGGKSMGGIIDNFHRHGQKRTGLRGRTDRRDYWVFILTFLVILAVLLWFAEKISFMDAFVKLYCVLMILPILAATARRLHEWIKAPVAFCRAGSCAGSHMYLCFHNR